jgi:hypothetical protein
VLSQRDYKILPKQKRQHKNTMGTNLVFGIFLVFCFLGCISAVPFSLFFPSGEGRGDTILQTGDDISTNEIPLNTPIAYYDGTYSSIYVSFKPYK